MTLSSVMIRTKENQEYCFCILHSNISLSLQYGSIYCSFRFTNNFAVVHVHYKIEIVNKRLEILFRNAFQATNYRCYSNYSISKITRCLAHEYTQAQLRLNSIFDKIYIKYHPLIPLTLYLAVSAVHLLYMQTS